MHEFGGVQAPKLKSCYVFFPYQDLGYIFNGQKPMMAIVCSAGSTRSWNVELAASLMECLACCVTVFEDYYGAVCSEIEKTVLHAFAMVSTCCEHDFSSKALAEYML